MISTITTQNMEALLGAAERDMNDAQLDHQDDRSSSLSELDDGLEEQLSNLDSKESTSNELENDLEVDSETETERLMLTPRKITDLNPPSSAGTGRSPSKLNQEIPLEDVMSTEGSPLQNRSSSGSRKRKRGDSDTTSLSEVDDLQPMSKRLNHEDREDTPGSAEVDTVEAESDEEEPERPEEEPLEDELEDVADDVDLAEEIDDDTLAPPEPALATSKIGRGKKAKKKGRRVQAVDQATEPPEPSEAEHDSAENGDGPDEELEEEEESRSQDEEIAKRKAAVELFMEIEKAFTSFRRLQLEASLRRIDAELQLLDERSCKHPEYLAQIQCVDRRRDEKVRYEDTILVYDQQALRVRTVAERDQFHSQYFQACREIRDGAFDACNKEYYALQADRRRFGALDSGDLLMYNPDRQAQIKRQTAYNLEVSLLAGIAKHVGFPSAPEIKGLTTADLESDLRAMGIATPATRLLSTQSFVSAAKATARDPVAVDEQFLEQNPWAANQPAFTGNTAATHAYHHAFAVTPAAQRTAGYDPSITVGSASTLELPSNPPSSNVRPLTMMIDTPTVSVTKVNLSAGDTLSTTKSGVAEKIAALANGAGVLAAHAAAPMTQAVL